MSQQAFAMAQKGLPWRRGLAWWVVGIEGAIITIVGVYVVAAPDDAREIVRQIIGWFLIANAVLAIAASLRADGPTNPITPYRMLGAGVGLTVGLLVALEPVSDYVDSDAAKVILALGLLGHGLVGLVGAFATRASGGLRRGPLISGGVNIALALLLFYNARRDALDPRWFGIFAIVAGVLVLGYAFALYRELHKQDAAAAAQTTLLSPVPDAVPSSAESASPPVAAPTTDMARDSTAARVVEPPPVPTPDVSQLNKETAAAPAPVGADRPTVPVAGLGAPTTES
jgi:uncharacterized membrane protein HdeD (DUF308 family)